MPPDLDPTAQALAAAKTRWRRAAERAADAKASFDAAVTTRDNAVLAAVQATATPNYPQIAKRFGITPNGVRHIVRKSTRSGEATK